MNCRKLGEITAFFRVDCFGCIFISTEDLAYFNQFSQWLHDFSISCSTCSKSTNSMKPNGNISTQWAKVLYFVWQKVLFHIEIKVFLLQQPFRKRFSNSRSNRFSNATVCETPMRKKCFDSCLAFS